MIIMEHCIYLNNAATSFPKPEQVLQAVYDNLGKPPFHHARTGYEQQVMDVVLECRKELADLFNAPVPERLIFSSGSTESLNLVLNGLPIDGKHVVTTSMEHNSVLRPLKTMEREGRISCSIINCDHNGLVHHEEIERAIQTNTGAVVVNHCSNVTGAINNLQEIGHITRQKGVFFIADVSQSAGVHDIDVQGMNIDILVFTGHKSLYGIQGVGGAYIGEGITLKPLKVGGTGVRSDYLFQPESLPMYYEAGTQNIPGIVSLYEGVKYIKAQGMDSIRKKKEELIEIMMHNSLKEEQIITYPQKDCEEKTTIFSFNIKGIDPDDVGYILENSFGIVVRAGLHCAPLIHKNIGTFPKGSVRISPSHFTTYSDIQVFNKAMDQIVQMVD